METSKEAMTLEEYGDKLINDDLGKLVESNPYFAFIVLASAIEFIARCRDGNNAKESGKKYVETIDCLNSFEKYRKFTIIKGKGHTNKIYTDLRCGLLHTTMPDKGIKLSSGENELQNNVVGCVSLYEDVKKAWAEIKSDPSILQYLQTNKGLVISETLPSNTEEKKKTEAY